MTDIVPPIDLAALRHHVERLHRLAEAYGVGSLKLVSNGLDPQRPRPLPPLEQSFPIGGIDPMAEAAMRLNREPGRNVTVPLAIYDDAGDVVAVFGFALKVTPRPAGWLAQLPLAPSAALVADKTGWAIFLLNAAVPPPAVFDVARQIAEFARIDLGPGDGVLLAGAALCGSLYTATSGAAVPVTLELAWRAGYRLDQLIVGLEPEGGPPRMTFPAVRPPPHSPAGTPSAANGGPGAAPGGSGAGGSGSGGSGSGGSGSGGSGSGGSAQAAAMTTMRRRTTETPPLPGWGCVCAPKTARLRSAPTSKSRKSSGAKSSRISVKPLVPKAICGITWRLRAAIKSSRRISCGGWFSPSMARSIPSRMAVKTPCNCQKVGSVRSVIACRLCLPYPGFLTPFPPAGSRPDDIPETDLSRARPLLPMQAKCRSRAVTPVCHQRLKPLVSRLCPALGCLRLPRQPLPALVTVERNASRTTGLAFRVVAFGKGGGRIGVDERRLAAEGEEMGGETARKGGFTGASLGGR